MRRNTAFHRTAPVLRLTRAPDVSRATNPMRSLDLMRVMKSMWMRLKRMRLNPMHVSCRRILNSGFLAVAGVAGLVSPVAASDYSVGGTFLSIGHGARAHALGGAGIALQRDDAAIYWNPANLAWIQTTGGATLMHAEVLPEVGNGYDTVSYGRPAGHRIGETTQPMRPAAWGFGVFYSHFGLDFEAGDWSENRLQLGGSWAFCNFASVGLGMKALWLGTPDGFDTGGASGLGFDVALSVLVTEHWFAAAVWRDLWTRVSYDTDTHQTLSPSLDLGLERGIRRKWSAEGDISLREGGMQRFMLGVEWRPRDYAAARAGWTSILAGESRGYPSAGAGLRWSRLALDYGASFDSDEALGLGHRFALRIGL